MRMALLISNEDVLLISNKDNIVCMMFDSFLMH